MAPDDNNNSESHHFVYLIFLFIIQDIILFKGVVKIINRTIYFTYANV